MARPTPMVKKLFILAAVIAFVAVALYGYSAWTDPMGPLGPQPLDFNHKIHMEKVQGITCKKCHPYAYDQIYAGLPSKNICFDCHDPDDPGNADAPEEFDALFVYMDIPDEIRWQRVTETRKDVFFPHRRHVTVGQMECEECHPGFAELSSAPARGPIVMLMAECVDCHERENASEDCIACHR